MIARAVIGSNFGDEGKGLVTDYLCSIYGAGVVVRFNGGSNAGHTVVTPEGLRHVHRHFGSGTLLGIPTYLSQFFICNPLTWQRELQELAMLKIKPVLYAHPNCLVTTFADMMINQQMEDHRGAKRHGSVGAGINETVNRSDIPPLKITMADLWNRRPLEKILTEICGKYAAFRAGKKIDKPEQMIAAFLQCCEVFANNVNPLGIQQCKDPIFEGAQGLLLDQNNKEFFPHLTRSNTGMTNVRFLCERAGIKNIETYYVSRTYLTRHGAGPLPSEDQRMKYADDTNGDHPYQGLLRFAPLNVASLMERCRKDAGSRKFKLVLTHCDQRHPPCAADLYANGPTGEFVEEKANAASTKSG